MGESVGVETSALISEGSKFERKMWSMERLAKEAGIFLAVSESKQEGELFY